MTPWTCAIEYDGEKNVVAGSTDALNGAIRRAADLSIYTEFRHSEHIDANSGNPEMIREVAQRGVTYLLDDRWSAGIITQRQPIEPPEGFGPRPSLSFFMYNQDARQAFARPYLDGPPSTIAPNPNPPDFGTDLPKMNLLGGADKDTNAPSAVFTYAFDSIRYFVRDDWEQILDHGTRGEIRSGSLDALVKAFEVGAEMKIGIRGLCADLNGGDTDGIDHEVFINLHSYYYCTDSRQFTGGTFPLVRLRPSIPLIYRSRAWDFGWVMVRSDGHVALTLYDPYTLLPRRATSRCAIRWFVR
jgi:hypothetical protein